MPGRKTRQALMPGRKTRQALMPGRKTRQATDARLEDQAGHWYSITELDEAIATMQEHLNAADKK